jgi:hypothetical protein
MRVAHAAKCLVVMVKIGKKQTRYVLATAAGRAHRRPPMSSVRGAGLYR